MRDTSPELEQLQRDILMKVGGVDRMAMASSMFETARILVLERLRQDDPSASELELAERLFLRFYGADLGREYCERVLKAKRLLHPGSCTS